jgi:pimeloyl-ACP methyl ester carboxylesterase
VDTSIADTLAVLNFVQEVTGLSRVVLVGVSYGSIVASVVAEHYPERVAGAVLLGLIYAAIGVPLDDMLAEAAKAPAGYAFTTEEEWPELFIPSAAADVIAWHQAQFGTAYAYPVGPYFEVQKIPHATKLDRFHGHVLVVTGELDPFATGPDVEAFLNAVGTEKARARHLRQARVGHMPYVEARAGEVQQAINDLVDAATAEV